MEDRTVKRLEELMDIENIFNYDARGGLRQEQYKAIRDAAKILATVIVEVTPECADQSAAMRKLRECVFTANAAIALKGRL